MPTPRLRPARSERRGSSFWPALLALGLASLPASRASAAWPKTIQVGAKVEARATATTTSAVEAPGVAADDPQRLGSDTLYESRLRAGGFARWEIGGVWLQALQLDLQADFFAAPLTLRTGDAGDGNPARLGADPLLTGTPNVLSFDATLLRQFAIEAEGRFFRLAAGRMVSRWGLGLLAQSGDDEPYQFGLKRRGAVVDRAQIALLPAGIPGDGSYLGVLPLALVFAADSVVDDDLASKRAGDDARQLIAAALLRYPEVELGAYGVRRWQTDAVGLGLNAWVADVYGSWSGKVRGLRVSAGTEWLWVQGDTTWFRTATSPSKLKVAQSGGLVRLRIEDGNVGVQIDGGYASGDDTPFDDTISNFKMARDMRVGLVLFGEMWRRQSAAIVANLSDTRFTGQAPAGADRFTSAGSATGALWTSQTIRARVGKLTLLGGLLYAKAPGPLVDPHRTGLNGGTPTGPRGGRASTDLGFEFDGAGVWDEPLGAGLTLRARIDFGVAFPGLAFAGANGDEPAAVGAAVGQIALRGAF